jgi:sRNA-binding carbon storage regulator CsrA
MALPSQPQRETHQIKDEAMEEIKGLVLTCKVGERIAVAIGGEVCWVSVAHCEQGRAKIVFSAPQSVVIVREKFLNRSSKCQAL